MSIIALTSLPAAAKTHRTVYTEAMVQKAKQKIATQEWAKKQVTDYEAKSQYLIEMSDEELWNFIPPADQYRALNVHFGSDCPIHGTEIHRKGGHYPWIMSRDKPFKVECPIGHEVYPSNDFKPWWAEGKAPVTPENSSPHEKYVDNGAGWVDEKGERYWFVAHYMFWQRWRGDVLPGLENLAQAYLLTGNPIYGHKCAVMLARLAQEYPKMDYLKQAYHHDYPTKVRGKILDYIWETSTVNTLANAYDAAYPATDMKLDPELSKFLQSKGLPDLRVAIEKNIITEMIEALMNNTIRGNMGMPQRAMAGLALVLDNDDPAKGHTTKELVDWILKTEPGKTTGETEALFYNGFYRDGHGGESSPGYSAGWNGNFYTVAKDLDRLGVNLFARPKMKKMADILLDMTMAGTFSPAIGDNGTAKGANRLWSANVFKEAWVRYRDPRYAQALRLMNFQDQSLWEDSVAEEVRAASAGMGDEVALSTRNLGGYGLAVLETGTGKDRRAVSLYYGSAAGGHGHRDRLTTESWFYGQTMMSEHGYPAHWLPKNPYWTANTLSHYAVVVDKKWQQTVFGGHLTVLADSPTARVMEASAETAYPKEVTRYRHTTAMIDLSPTRSYLFDVWRVRGGSQHDWSFHGFPFADFSAPTLHWSAQKAGTLAGESVKFADEKAPDKSSGFQYLFNVRKATPDSTFTSEWKSTQNDTALRMTLLQPPAEVFAADCEPELQPGMPETMSYLIARQTGAPGQKDQDSTFAAVIEPVKGQSSIQSARPLIPLKANPDFAGAQVEFIEDGVLKTDYVLSGMGPKTSITLPDGMEFAGQFGVASEDRLLLVNGTKLRFGKYLLEAKPLSAKIGDINAAKNEITLNTLLPANTLSGKVVTISNTLHSVSYTIHSAVNREGKTVLNFGDVLPIIGEGHITAVDAARGTLTTDTVLGGHARVDGGEHRGRWLTNSQRTAVLKIKKFTGTAFQVEGTLSENDFADGRFFIIDFGIGDIVEVPSIQSVQRGSDGEFRIQSTLPFTLTIPAENGAYVLQHGADWQPVTAPIVNGTRTLRIDPADFANGETILKPTSK